MIHSENNIEALQIYPALLDEVLQQHSQAIVLLNADAQIIFCSESMKRITGYAKEELTGRTAFEFIDPADISSARKQHEYLLGGNGNSSASLVRIRNKHGNMIWIDVSVKNLLHAPGIRAIFVLLKNSCDAGAEERKLLQAINTAKEEERAFIACELHDNINQVITASKLLVDGAIINKDQKEELLKLSSVNLQLVIDEIRSLSHSMANFHLQKHGLAFAIDALIANMSTAGSLKFEKNLQTSAVKALTNEQQFQVYRIIQEAINNIFRHASATLAEIEITRRDQMIYLMIKDNGKGFLMKSIKPGMGLSSITNRVKILQGQFLVHAPQGEGTTIEIHFPM
jgi:PAS domain S-box-containing protein